MEHRRQLHCSLDPVLNITNKFLGAFAKSRKRLFSLSCSSIWNTSAPAERIIMKFDILPFFQKLSRKFQFHKNVTRITGTLYEDVSTFMISRRIIFKVRNVSDKKCRESENTH